MDGALRGANVASHELVEVDGAAARLISNRITVALWHHREIAARERDARLRGPGDREPAVPSHDGEEPHAPLRFSQRDAPRGARDVARPARVLQADVAQYLAECIHLLAPR